ncbi:hypothetical protein GCM10020331_018850 [Ectobacillus funiculus]
MIGLLESFYESKEVQSVLNGLNEGLKEQLVSGMSTSSRLLLSAALYKQTKRTQLIVTHNLYQAQKGL